MSEGFKASIGPLMNEKLIRHNQGRSRMRIAGPFDTEDDAKADLPRYTGARNPFIWQHTSP
jgi:hypothetical protein